MAKILVVASWHDVPTTISAYSAVSVAEKLLSKGHEVDLAFGMSASRIPLMVYLSLKNYDMIVYSGHGTDNTWVGNDLLFGMISTDNVDVLRGRIAIGIPVCLSARVLGPEAVRKGALSFMGSKDLMWCAFPEVDHNYMEDFIDCWQTPVLEVADGATVKEAYDCYVEKCKSYLDLYESKIDVWHNADWYYEALEKNMEYYTVLGRLDSTINDAEKSHKGNPSVGLALFMFTVIPLTIAGATAVSLMLKEKIYSKV
ncbi:MAG: hypothetical protein QXQ95_08710 [Thermofilum sp.]|uniref:hypothetical protein n=1 Tax=Thermofilum sp. TaxID=1961369 RepID=UPI003178A4C4